MPATKILVNSNLYWVVRIMVMQRIVNPYDVGSTPTSPANRYRRDSPTLGKVLRIALAILLQP